MPLKDALNARRYHKENSRKNQLRNADGASTTVVATSIRRAKPIPILARIAPANSINRKLALGHIVALREVNRHTAALVAAMLKNHGRELEDVTAEETAAGRVLQEGADEAGAGDELPVFEEAVLVDAADLADDLVRWVVGEEDALEGAAAVDSQAGDAGGEEGEKCRRGSEDV